MPIKNKYWIYCVIIVLVMLALAIYLLPSMLGFMSPAAPSKKPLMSAPSAPALSNEALQKELTALRQREHQLQKEAKKNKQATQQLYELTATTEAQYQEKYKKVLDIIKPPSAKKPESQ